MLLHNAWLTIVGYHVGMLIVLLFSRGKFAFKRLLQSNNLKVPAIAAAIGASSGVLLYTLFPVLALPGDTNEYLRNMGLTQATLPIFALYFVLVNPLLEEYYWRGYLGSGLKRITLNDFLFAGYHIFVLAGKITVVWLVVAFLVLVFGAWLWRQADRLSQGLLPSAVSHLAADITIMLTVVFILG